MTRRFFSDKPLVLQASAGGVWLLPPVSTHGLILLQVGDTMFVHGGVLPGHVDYGLDRINRENHEWMTGKDKSGEEGQRRHPRVGSFA